MSELPRNATPQPANGNGLSVLVVDDDLDNAAVISEIIAARGHRVRTADRGRTALELMEQQQANVMFLDVTLPDMSGYEVAATVRARFGKACRIVALTGLTGDHDRNAARRAGCDAFVVKPCDIAELLRFLGVSTGVTEAPPRTKP